MACINLMKEVYSSAVKIGDEDHSVKFEEFLEDFEPAVQVITIQKTEFEHLKT